MTGNANPDTPQTLMISSPQSKHFEEHQDQVLQSDQLTGGQLICVKTEAQALIQTNCKRKKLKAETEVDDGR